MSEYRVFFTPAAEAEILESYEWGVSFWGADFAETWLRELYEAVFRRMKGFPLSCPVAPESEAGQTVVRQFLFRRYRILFEVKGDMVIVLHLVGPFNS